VQQPDNEHFRHFAGQLETNIGRHGKVKNWRAFQKHQIEELIALETAFRSKLVKHQYGMWAYRQFVDFITTKRKNILAARPYFRERQETFAKKISKALKERNVEALTHFAINYQFVLFIVSLQPRGKRWGTKSPITRIAEKIRVMRQTIVEMNMPLGISRARVFYSRTPKSHLSYMDEIQIAAEGMMSGMDKYTPDGDGVDPKGFSATMINRTSGDLIQNYSETMLHFYPVDKRKLYRANKVIGQHAGGVDFDKLSEQVNKKTDKDGEDEGEVDEQHKTTPTEIADLMAAASCVSADSSLPTDPDAPEPITRFAAPEATRPDVIVEQQDAMKLMVEATTQLTVFERKLLRLKGIRL
jgi:DNA-directed RNA polymerase specialized sigma subunit